MSASTINIPSTQKAIVIHENGGFDVLKYEDIAVPKIRPTQVLVKNSYSGINFIESYFRKGIYKSVLPLVLGREGAGEVVAIGDQVTKFKVGDKVGYIYVVGAFSHYIAVYETGKIVKLPQGISEKDWAATAVQWLTARTLILEAHRLQKGEIALINAPVGGVGQYLVQMAKKIGATVIATTSTDEKAELAKQLGADYVINYKEEDIAEGVMELTEDKGVNVSYDSAGAATYNSSLDSLTVGGTYVSYGNSSGPVPPITLITLPNNIKIVRPIFGLYISKQDDWDRYVQEMFDALTSGDVKPKIHGIYDLSDYAKATEELESGSTVGKLLLKID